MSISKSNVSMQHAMMTVILLLSLLIIVTVSITLFSDMLDNIQMDITLNTNINIINISSSHITLHSKRQAAILQHINHDYDCDYIQVKGQGKSGTTWLKNILRVIEHTLCTETDYKNSYHYTNSKYSMCKDWTNGSANYISHATHYNRHARHTIRNILITQESRKNENNSILSKYFMGNGMYDLWINNELRYCVFMVMRDPRSRVISRINTHHKKINNNTMVDNIEKNKIFKSIFNKQYLKEVNTWWNKYSTLEKNNVLDWYIYFYEDFRINTYQILKDMIWFAGYDNYINDRLIYKIIDETDIKRLVSRNRVNGGNICSFHSENSLSVQTKYYANQLMASMLNNELIQKFNKTCAIDI
eukprot:77084_1